MTLNTDHLKRCIDTLESALVMLKKSVPGSLEYEVFRNASIKGFELTLETSGKLLRKTLRPYLATSKEADRLTLPIILGLTTRQQQKLHSIILLRA